MTSTMANSDKLSPNTKFNNKDNIEIERMQTFGRIGFVTITSKMKRKLSKRSYKAIMVGIPKHHLRNSYYMYNTETKRIVICRDIIWASFERPDFNKGLDEVFRPKINDENNEEPDVNIELSDEDENGSEAWEQRGGYEPDITIVYTKDEDQNPQQSSVEGSRIRHQLETKLNSGYVTPRNRTCRIIVNAIDENHTECIYNTATISDANIPNDIEEVLKRSDKKEWQYQQNKR